MTEKEIRTEMKLCGWSFLRRKRGKQEYIYATRKVNHRRVERYICPLAKLAELSRSSLSVKLNLSTEQRQPDGQATTKH